MCKRQGASRGTRLHEAGALAQAEEARLARRVKLAEQIIVEADSGGHTDNRPLGSPLAVVARLRDRLEKTIFRMALAEVWTRTQRFFAERDPALGMGITAAVAATPWPIPSNELSKTV